MSHTYEEDQRRVESSNRMRAEPEVGPSRAQPSRQGYCGYCRVLYGNLEQHLASLKHLDSVHLSRQGSNPSSTPTAGRSRQSLMERFLHDVLQYHPHRYQDNRPSHADLPCISTPPLPRTGIDEACFSDDSHLLGTCEHPSVNNPDVSHQLANQVGVTQSVTAEVIHDRLSGPVREEEQGTHALHAETASCHDHTRPTAPRKAHRKTNRRKTSSNDSPPRVAVQSGPQSDPQSDPQSVAELRPHACTHGGLGADTGPPSDLGPWSSRQEERREAQDISSLDQGSLLDQTIEEVIQKCCHGVSSTSCHKERFFFSLPVSMETQSEDGDSVVQVDLQTPVQVRQSEDQHVSRLMEVQVDLEDQMYAQKLDRALQSQQRARDGPRLEEGCWALPIEDVLPAPEHIPESFRGKTWIQIEQEDEEKVEKLVQQFRKEKFICYFDSESLARFGRRNHRKQKHYDMVLVSDSGVLPLLDPEHDGSECVKRTKRRVFKLASRCQVVKVSHSTQTIQLVAPAVRQPGLDAPPTSTAAANQDTEERTPDIHTRSCLPRSYSNVMTPLQPHTSFVYLLCSPSTSSSTPALSPLPKRCRKKKRPLSLQGRKVTYKHFPLQFYEPSTNRILKNPPEGYLAHQGSASSSLPPPCVRQLFRSLSPDLNADSHSFLLKTNSRDAAHTNTVRGQNRGSHSRSDRRRGLRKVKTCLPTTKARIRAEAPPTQGLRRTGPSRKAPKPGCARHSVPVSQRASGSGRSRKRRQR